MHRPQLDIPYAAKKDTFRLKEVDDKKRYEFTLL